MHRTSMTVFVAGLLLNAAAFGQSQPAQAQPSQSQSQSAQAQSGDSLADIARANRAKLQAQGTSGATPKVITNQDLPAGSTAAPESNPADAMTTVSGVHKSDHSADQRLNQRLMAEQRVGQQWKGRIQDQEARIADLQAHIDRVNAAMNAAVGTAQYDRPVNRYQTVQLERLEQMQEMLNEQKEKLATMVDEARHAGMNQ